MQEIVAFSSSSSSSFLCFATHLCLFVFVFRLTKL